MMTTRRRIFTRIHGNESVVIIIDSLTVRDGSLPKRALAMVLEWATEHCEELMADWRLAAEHKPLKKIAPLE